MLAISMLIVKTAWRSTQCGSILHRVKQCRARTVTDWAVATAYRHTTTQRHLPLAWIEQHAFTCLVTRVDSAHHLYGVGETSTSLQETGNKHVRISWATIRLQAALLRMMIIVRVATLWACLHTPVAVVYGKNNRRTFFCKVEFDE